MTPADRAMRRDRRDLRAKRVARALDTFTRELASARRHDEWNAIETAVGATLRYSIFDNTSPADLVAIYRAVEQAATHARAEERVELLTRLARYRFAALDRADREQVAA